MGKWRITSSNKAWLTLWMRSYLSAKIIGQLSYTCFSGNWALRQFGGKGPNTPKSSTESHKKKSKVFNSLFHIKWDLMLVSSPSVHQIIPVLRYWGNFGKLGPNTPNHVQGLSVFLPFLTKMLFKNSLFGPFRGKMWVQVVLKMAKKVFIPATFLPT